MSRKRKYLQKSQPPTYPINIPRETSLEDITLLQAKLEIEKSQLIQKGLTSTDPWDIIKTQRFLQNQSKSEDGMLKSFLINPDLTSLNTNNYRVPNKGVSYETLKRMSRTPIIRTIIGTRVDQVAGFAEPSDNEQTKGWMVRKKKTILNSKDKTEPTKEELKKIEYMTKFVQSGGTSDNKWSFESLEEYIRQITNDSLTIDQINMECVSNKKGELVMFYPVDASTIQLVDDSREEYLAQYFKKIQGYYPKYVQVWQGQVFTAYYPWEMTFGVRNKVTDINSNGYGISELEDMINIVTWLLYGMQYNGNFFSQGSNPKGFFTVEGNVSPNSLNDFKQMWRNTISGVQNSHKIPVIEATSKINWVDMQTTNKDMEFDLWMEFLMVVTCSLFKIDPSECGYQLQKSSQIFGQDGQKERLQHSQSKGLVPILRLLQRIFTKYIVERLDEDYEFVFTGVETEDQVQTLDMDVKKVTNGFMSMEDGFKKWSGRDFDSKKDTVLSQVYMQMAQMKQMGGAGMNEIVDEQNGVPSENPFEQKPEDQDSFEKSLNEYLNISFKNKLYGCK